MAENTEPSPNLKPPWQKGQSGNPGGRPKGDAWFRALCRKKTLRALRSLVATMEGPDPGPAVSAAKAILEFGWGKAPAVVTIPEDGTADATPITPKTALQVLIARQKPDNPD